MTSTEGSRRAVFQTIATTSYYEWPTHESTPLSDRDSLEALTELSEEATDELEALFDEPFDESADQVPSTTVQLTSAYAIGAPIPVEMRVKRTGPREGFCVARPTHENGAEQRHFELLQGTFHRRAIEGSTELIVAVDRNERIIFANKRYRDFHRLEEPVQGTPIQEVISPKVYSKAKEHMKQVEAGETGYFEMEQIGPNGSKHVFENNYFPLKTSDGRIQGSVAMLREITELKNRGRSLRQFWETYQGLLDGYTEPILIHDSDGEILEVNQRACQVFGYNEEELLEKHITSLCSRDRLETMTDDELSLQSDPEIFEAYCQSFGGEEIPVRITASWIDYFGSEAILCVPTPTDRVD